MNEQLKPESDASKERITITMPPDLLARLKREAEVNTRSLSGQIVHLCRQALRETDR